MVSTQQSEDPLKTQVSSQISLLQCSTSCTDTTPWPFSSKSKSQSPYQPQEALHQEAALPVCSRLLLLPQPRCDEQPTTCSSDYRGARHARVRASAPRRLSSAWILFPHQSQLHPDAWAPNPFTLLRLLLLSHVARIFKHTVESIYYLHSLPSLFPPRM